MVVLGSTPHQGEDDQGGQPDGRLPASQAQESRQLFPHGCPLPTAPYEQRNGFYSRRDRTDRK